ncbi:MAG TPA: GDSL-type esterase/lipase family protein [Pseudonocardia sp.]
MPRSRAALVALLVLVNVAGTVAGAGAGSAAAAPAEAAVVLGDSAASGEGAGDYAPGTRGEGGDWCHRSPHAYLYAARLAPVSIDLACSGANAADVEAGGSQYGEAAQSTQLAGVARRYRVTTVVLQIGANDAAALTDTGITCIKAFLDALVPPCRQTVGPLVPQRMAATASAVEKAVGDVRAAMRGAGYADRAWRLVLVSYAAPVTGAMIPLQGVRGCPYSRADAEWGRTALFPALSTALRGVAARTGAGFLDLDRATEGREACTHDDPAQDWQRRVTVDAHALAFGGLDAVGFHVAQESFHPTAAAHAAIGGCLAAFVRSGAATGACLPGGGATLTLRPSRA